MKTWHAVAFVAVAAVVVWWLAVPAAKERKRVRVLAVKTKALEERRAAQARWLRGGLEKKGT